MNTAQLLENMEDCRDQAHSIPGLDQKERSFLVATFEREIARITQEAEAEILDALECTQDDDHTMESIEAIDDGFWVTTRVWYSTDEIIDTLKEHGSHPLSGLQASDWSCGTFNG